MSISGDVQRPGNYEIELGITGREIVYGLAGGPPEGRKVKCWFPGGSSAPVLLEEHLDLPYTFEAMAQAGSMLGSGAVIVVDEEQPIVPLALRLAGFYRHESCGKCVPCREGTNWTVKLLERVDSGEATPMDLEIMAQVQENIMGNCLCVLGDSMAMPVGSMLKHFQRGVRGAHRTCARRLGPRGRHLMARPEVKLVTFEIDGREVQAPEGTMLVDAAKHGDVEIPYFCYEPKLGQPVGACRMCLVEIEGIPKLQTSCSTPVRDGMVVVTTSDRVRHAQNAVVEFLLVNHPLDCPVCDKGGECPLQDISFGWGAGRSRYIEPKRHFKKPLALSPLVAIDRERCILCYRCVRFSQEVAEDNQLVFLERGDHTFVGTHDGFPYVGPFSGNIIELCPVGALTSTSYRFRARPWDIEDAGTVCAFCPSQCNVKLTIRDDAKVVRVLARDHAEVDDGWLCDKGRFGYQSFSAEERITAPMVRDGGYLREVSWERALSGRDRGAEALRRGHRRLRQRADHQRGGLPRAAAHARRARLRLGRVARGLAARPGTGAPARPARPDRARLGHRSRGRDPRGGHRAGGRGADPRPARAQGRAPQRRAARDALGAPHHARRERRRGRPPRSRRRGGGARRAGRRARLHARVRHARGPRRARPRERRLPPGRHQRQRRARRPRPMPCARPPTCCAAPATWS